MVVGTLPSLHEGICTSTGRNNDLCVWNIFYWDIVEENQAISINRQQIRQCSTDIESVCWWNTIGIYICCTNCYRNICHYCIEEHRQCKLLWDHLQDQYVAGITALSVYHHSMCPSIYKPVVPFKNKTALKKLEMHYQLFIDHRIMKSVRTWWFEPRFNLY